MSRSILTLQEYVGRNDAIYTDDTRTMREKNPLDPRAGVRVKKFVINTNKSVADNAKGRLFYFFSSYLYYIIIIYVFFPCSARTHIYIYNIVSDDFARHEPINSPSTHYIYRRRVLRGHRHCPAKKGFSAGLNITMYVLHFHKTSRSQYRAPRVRRGGSARIKTRVILLYRIHGQWVGGTGDLLRTLNPSRPNNIISRENELHPISSSCTVLYEYVYVL